MPLVALVAPSLRRPDSAFLDTVTNTVHFCFRSASGTMATLPLLFLLVLVAIASTATTTEAFLIGPGSRAIVGSSSLARVPPSSSSSSSSSTVRLAATEEKAAPLVSGADLEVMLTEWDQPLVVDAYATWCVCFFSLPRRCGLFLFLSLSTGPHRRVPFCACVFARAIDTESCFEGLCPTCLHGVGRVFGRFLAESVLRFAFSIPQLHQQQQQQRIIS